MSRLSAAFSCRWADWLAFAGQTHTVPWPEHIVHTANDHRPRPPGWCILASGVDSDHTRTGSTAEHRPTTRSGTRSGTWLTVFYFYRGEDVGSASRDELGRRERHRLLVGGAEGVLDIAVSRPNLSPAGMSKSQHHHHHHKHTDSPDRVGWQLFDDRFLFFDQMSIRFLFEVIGTGLHIVHCRDSLGPPPVGWVHPRSKVWPSLLWSSLGTAYSTSPEPVPPSPNRTIRMIMPPGPA